MLVPWADLNIHHPSITQCVKGPDWKRHRIAAEESRSVTERALRTYGRPLTMLTSFKYLGRILTALDDDWPEVASNLRGVRN